jgi:hypothetical protein
LPPVYIYFTKRGVPRTIPSTASAVEAQALLVKSLAIPIDNFCS